MNKRILTGLHCLQVAILLTCLGCSSIKPEPAMSTDITVPSQAGPITLLGSLSAQEFASGQDIKITAIVKNTEDTPITLKEGRFIAVFIVEGEARTFLQSVRASYKTGVKTVTVNPGEEYEEPFVIHQEDWGQQRKLVPGLYHMRISYLGDDRFWRPQVNRRANRVEGGVVKALDSQELEIRIK